MFKNEIKFIYDFNLNEVKKLGNYITYEQLLSANLHPAILQYISADIDYLIFEDRQKILRNSIFDYSGEKIHQQFSLIGEEIKRTKRFSLEYMAKLILHASSFTANFVVRPRWALTKFIFDDENHKNTTEIKQILNYLYYYGHLRRIIVSYINRKKILSINEKEFVDLIYRIDMLSVESNARNIVQSSLKSMADFFNIGENSNRSTIPLKAVELFLEEKEFDKHLAKLKSVYGEEDKRIGLIDCLKVLDEEMYSKVDSLEPEELEVENDESSEPENVISEEESKIEEPEITEEQVNEEILLPDETTPEEQIPEVDVEPEPRVSDEIVLDAMEEPAIEKSDFDERVEEVFKKSEKTEIVPEENNSKIDENTSDSLLFDFEEENRNVGKDQSTLFDFVKEEERSAPPIQSEAEEEEAEDEDIDNLFAELEKAESTEEIIEKELNLSDEEEEEIPEMNSFQEALEKEAEIIEDEVEIKEDNIESEIQEPEESEPVIPENVKIPDEKAEVKNRLSNLVKVVRDEKKEEIENEEIEEETIPGEEVPELVDEFEPEDESIEPEEKTKTESGSVNIDISEILENKNLTKVIEVIFDYDIEDFALTIEKACKAGSYQSGVEYLNRVFHTNHVDPQSKEAEALKSVVAQFFNNTK
jgi:hypothetical protein